MQTLLARKDLSTNKGLITTDTNIRELKHSDGEIIT